MPLNKEVHFNVLQIHTAISKIDLAANVAIATFPVGPQDSVRFTLE